MNVLILGPFSLQNAGDNAILRGAVRLLAEAFPGARLTVASHDAAPVNAPLAEARFVGNMLTWITTVRPDRTFAVHRLAWLGYAALTLLLTCGARLGQRRWRWLADPAKQAFWQAYVEADLVVANGGGYLLQDKPWTPWFIGIIWELALAIGLGKPLILLPQSIGPLPGWEQRWLVRWLVQRAARVLLRDQVSLDYLHAIGARGHCQLCPDLALLQPTAPTADLQAWLAAQSVPWPPTAPWIGLTAQDWAAQNRNFSAAQQAQYEATLAEVCAALIADGCVVLGLPQVCGPIAALDDRLVLQRLRDRLPEPAGFILLPDQPPPAVLQALYSHFDVLLGSRMHAMIFALNTGTPVVGMGGLPKMRGLLQWFGGEAWGHDIAQLETAALVAQIRQLRRGRPQLRLQLQQRVAILQRQLADLPALLQETWAQETWARARPSRRHE